MILSRVVFNIAGFLLLVSSAKAGIQLRRIPSALDSRLGGNDDRLEISPCLRARDVVATRFDLVVRFINRLIRKARHMKDFAGRIAVVTGGGSGMGRELIRQLVAEACNVAMCDVSAAGLGETQRLCEAAGLPQGLRVTTHIADVSDAAQVERFRDEVADRHATDKIHLLFNNAGIGSGGSMIAHSREEWERTFNICWGGVYNCTRAFLPMLQKAEAGHIVNTSSVNGFWASVGPQVPHTAYSAAKFAVKGFTEALIADLKINAPHIKCSVVMPGHIGTSIPLNSRKIQSGNLSDEMNARQIEQARARIASMGRDASKLADEDIQKLVAERERRFREDAPTTAAEAATIILDGVKADRWRILVGPDAEIIDEMVRTSPERAYDADFFEEFAKKAGWRLPT
jgi:NAD(P)-dependent dehydrogenase (short-subunit alcohol dehydrogenase family)